ncbi:MAG: ATP-binding protein [bacterium]
MPNRILKCLERVHERFSIKLFVLFSLFVLFISCTFTVFFINYQMKSLTDGLVNEGSILTRLLAYNCKLGVFSESEEMLMEPVNGILQQKGVMEVSVFNREGRLISREQRGEAKLDAKERYKEGKDLSVIFERLTRSKDPIFLDKKGGMEFWAPVVADSGYSTQEALFFTEVVPQKKALVIGFVNIAMDKGILDDRLNVLLIRSIFIGIFFLIIGLIVSYAIARRITGPLKRLTSAVKTMGTGDFVAHVPVETRDEIGKLAQAVNHMAESLQRRDEEKEHLGERLRHAQKMEAVGTLAGGLAHDFNNILTTILGNGALLYLKMDERDPLRPYVKEILDSSDMAGRLTKNLLIYSRKQPISLKPLHLNRHIDDIGILLERLIGEAIELNVMLSEEDLVIVGDAGQIDQVLFNLATNARDAMPGGGTFTITTESVESDEGRFSDHAKERPRRHALITVSDTGIGMDGFVRERIFDPFFTTKEVGKGTGLGLSTVYEIITRHGGYIEVSSEPDKGTQFRIFIPLSECEVEDEKEGLLQTYNGSETVLLAEDNEKVRNIAKSILGEHGYQVIDATNGDDAVKAFLEHKDEIRLLLFDVIMPKKNGKEAYEEIKKLKPDIRILFISGYDYNLIRKQGIIEDEGIDFIYKPISPFGLLQKVREVLDK